jgi:ABC-2 type transport system ATP-binding protein
MENCYAVKDVTKTYEGADRPAVSSLTFAIPEGEVTAVVGPNGAGKTTLVRLLLGLLTPTSGDISLEGAPLTNDGRVGRRVAYLPQQGYGRALLALTVTESVEALGRLKGLSSAEARRETAKLLEQLGLEGAAETRLMKASGGQRRLAALAGVLVGGRRVLILDEPSNDLDAEARQRVWDALGQARREGKTIILVTHNVLEADRVVDRVVLLSDGRLAACEPLPVLKARLDTLTVDLWSADPGALVGRPLAWARAEVSAGGRKVRLVCGRDHFPELAEWLRGAAGGGAVHWSMRTPTLEDVYFELNARKP